MNSQYDIAIVGSGFAGSLMAMIAKRLGHSVVLLEKGKHPRMMIGESSTPLSNLLLESLAERYDLPFLKPLCKWGSWQRSYPNIGCGLKRGFTFFHHDLDSQRPPNEVDHLLVAASPNDSIADTHWYRADFDEFLVEQTQALGVDYFDETIIEGAPSDCGWRLSMTRHGREQTIHAKFLFDATGPRGFLHHALPLTEEPIADFPATSALYSHFTDVSEYASIAKSPTETPYPMDAAALHHVFDGGWMWVLRFNNGLTSAGFAVSAKMAQRYNFADKEASWKVLLDSLPLVREQFASAKPAVPFTYVPRLSFRSSCMAGANWALLPSAAGFVDPLLSTGFPLTLLGITRLAQILECDLTSPQLENSLGRYAQQTDAELSATANLIAALYQNMDDFPTFRCLTLLYFVAASYAETARRLDKPELASSFLLQDHPVFGPESHRLLQLARSPLSQSQKRDLAEQIYRLIEDFDVAGLGNRPANHCYPVNATDLFASAHKLEATVADINRLLDRAGFFATPT